MKKSAVFTRKGPQRSSARRGAVTTIELPRQLWQQIDRWRREDGAKTRSEAIRRLLAQALASHPARRIGAEFAAKASDLAGQAIDRLADSSATKEEQAKRKRRLIKGPREFRTARRQSPNLTEPAFSRTGVVVPRCCPARRFTHENRTDRKVPCGERTVEYRLQRLGEIGITAPPVFYAGAAVDVVH
jgi:Arc/MetJ-type ribon-helix-helix transcriptional regulator